jgi:hypothetical protein
MTKIDLCIIGMPRSGTSFLCNILTNMGCDFFGNNKTLNDIYPLQLNPEGYFQRRDVHFICNNLKLFSTSYTKLNEKEINDSVIKIMNNTQIVDNKYNGIKEPYLLSLINKFMNINKKMVTILLVRNPYEVLNSSKYFMSKVNTHQKIINICSWNEYYLIFLENINKKHIIIVNYNNLIKNPEKFYENFYNDIIKYLPNLKKLTIKELSNIIKPNKFTYSNETIKQLPIQTKYIYKLLISGNYSEFNKETYNNIMKIKPNDKCFCNSGKKFKKCCKNN